jgi:hypothetical protein
VRPLPSPRELLRQIGSSGDMVNDGIDNKPRFHVAQLGIFDAFSLRADFGRFGIMNGHHCHHAVVLVVRNLLYSQ